ncbi:hypothetical protein ABEF95_014779 [Exophiala dermatitidis]
MPVCLSACSLAPRLSISLFILGLDFLFPPQTSLSTPALQPRWHCHSCGWVMRARTGCQPCRDRHVKCVRLPGLQKCQKCIEAQRDCLLNAPLHFRPVKSVRLKTVDGRRIKHDLRHSSLQVWVDVPAEVRFVSSNDKGESLDRPDLDIEEETDGEITKESESLLVESPSARTVISNTQADLLREQNPTSASASAAHPWASPPPHPAFHQSPVQHYSLQHTSPESQFSAPAHPSVGISSTHSATWFPGRQPSPALFSVPSNAASPNYGISSSWPFKSLHEARLLHHYIVHLSPQFDSCDKQSHFGNEIPRRAAHYPVIRSAIFAVSSRHMSLIAGAEDDESPHYVSECLRILITALEDPMGHFDENLLAAIILLRTHEELSDNDERCHLFGTTRLLNSIASFAADGGLRESASWVSLRQHIYICLTSQHPLTINLTNYRHSNVFQNSDDESWANRIIFIFASILTHVFRPEGEQQLSVDQWNELDADVRSWDLSKPWHFAPLFMERPDTHTTASDGPRRSVWPEVFVCNPAQVVGLQHYYLAKIVLAIYDPRLSRLSFDSLRLRRASESVVRENLRLVLGLAVSNDHVATAMFQASHILSACGMYLDDPEEQEAAVEFLVRMHTRLGWQTAHVLRDLKEQWQS